MSCDNRLFNKLFHRLPQRTQKYITALESKLDKEQLADARKTWQKLYDSTALKDKQHESMELDLNDDDSCSDNSSSLDYETTNIVCVPFDPSIPRVKQYLSHSEQYSFDVYFKELKHAFKEQHFTYVFDHLECSPSIAFMNEDIVKFFSEELKCKKSKNVVRALHAIHSLVSNPHCKPEFIMRILKEDNFFSYLFDEQSRYNYKSFCFLTREIFIDVISALFHKTYPGEWTEPYLKWLKDLLLEYSADIQKPPHIYFNVIAASLAVGNEALPLKFYSALIAYFRCLIEDMPRNKLSSHYLLKVWDELMLFFRHRIRYLFRSCENPNLSILKNNLENSIIRNHMKYDHLFVEEGYVPCEFPSIPSFPRLPKTFPTLEDMEKEHGNLKMMVGDIIGAGFCDECKQNKCSCISSYAVVHDVLDDIKFEVEKMQQLSPELTMECENISLDEQKDPSCPEEPQFYFNPSDSSDDDMTPEEMRDCYDSLINRSPTISYSFAPNPILEVWEKKVMPDFTGIFPILRKEKITPAQEQMGVLMDEQIHTVDTESLNENVNVEPELTNNLVAEAHSVENE